MSNAAVEIASTLQAAHIQRAPSTAHDVNPSTAASGRQPVSISGSGEESSGSDEIPLSVLRPAPRRPALPALPDLRFEQSYLASIGDARGWRAVAWITLRDQLVLPLTQGLLWTLLLAGWKHWNRGATLHGRGVGAGIRRWWWQVNNWPLPGEEKGVGRRDMVGKPRDVGSGEGLGGG